MATQRELRDRMRTLLHDAGQLVCEMAEVECEAQDAAQAQATADNSAMDATCDTIECPNCGAEFSVDCECPICKGHWLRHKQHQ